MLIGGDNIPYGSSDDNIAHGSSDNNMAHRKNEYNTEDYKSDSDDIMIISSDEDVGEDQDVGEMDSGVDDENDDNGIYIINDNNETAVGMLQLRTLTQTLVLMLRKTAEYIGSETIFTVVFLEKDYYKHHCKQTSI